MKPLDGLLATAGFALHGRFGRRLRARASFAAAVARQAAHWRGRPQTEVAAQAPALRYRLRRDGLKRALVADCFGLYAAALPEAPSAAVLAGALRLLKGGIVELAAQGERREALALAALVRVLHGEQVHLLAAFDVAAQSFHEQIAPRFSALGIPVGCVLRNSAGAARREAYACPVVCVAYREVAQDYLRDRVATGARRGPLSSALERLSNAGGRLMNAEPACALVEDADMAMVDDAQAPVALATEVDQSAERLLYEQALELVQGLAPDVDFVVGTEGVALTEAAAGRLERLVAPLGGIWTLRQRREELVALALEAVHLFRRDVDYRVQAGQVVFPPRPAQDEAPPGPDEALQKLVEVKEGCSLSARREVLARLSLPRFFAHYRALAGVCADARSLEAEFWSLYRLKCFLAGRCRRLASVAYRVFANVEDKREALANTVRDAAAADEAVVVAARRQAELQAIQAALQGAAGAKLAFAVLPALQTVAAGAAGAQRILVAELPDAARHVQRLQRDTGAAACTVLLSLDEEPIAARVSGSLAIALKLALRGRRELAPPLAPWFAVRMQRAAERAGRELRLELKAREQTLDDLLAFSGYSN